MDAEVAMMMTVFGAKRKPMNQLPKSSEKKYEGVSWMLVAGGSTWQQHAEVEDVLTRW